MTGKSAGLWLRNLPDSAALAGLTFVEQQLRRPFVPACPFVRRQVLSPASRAVSSGREFVLGPNDGEVQCEVGRRCRHARRPSRPSFRGRPLALALGPRLVDSRSRGPEKVVITASAGSRASRFLTSSELPTTIPTPESSRASPAMVMASGPENHGHQFSAKTNHQKASRVRTKICNTQPEPYRRHLNLAGTPIPSSARRRTEVNHFFRFAEFGVTIPYRQRSTADLTNAFASLPLSGGRRPSTTLRY